MEQAFENRRSFEESCQKALPKLRSVIRRMVGHPAQTDDLVQETLTKAWSSRTSFGARAAFSTWLCRIGVNLAIDALRREKRWRDRAQVAYANECQASEDLAMEVGSVIMSPDFEYDVREHVGFCFVCIGRSLEPELQAALVLRDVEELTNQEAAAQLGVSESVLRHRLGEARATMERSFVGLCSLVNKQGVCYQCSGLRDAVPDPAKKGAAAPEAVSFEKRLKIVREVDVDTGRTQELHDLFWKRIAAQERAGIGTTEPSAECAPAGDE